MSATATEKYLNSRVLYPSLIAESPPADLALIVTIPCRDEPTAERTLASLRQCALPDGSVEVILLINGSEKDAPAVRTRNLHTYQTAQTFAARYNSKKFALYPLHFPDLPPKHAGVGLARKIAMDEALRRLTAVQNPQGIIVCLDADSLVETNYLTAINDFFVENENCRAAGIHYAHPTEGDVFSEKIYQAIVTYELHLRYYVHALQGAGMPTAVQTVGSSMCVRAEAYAAQGGMNRRKAGEDFYFIHKFTGYGHYGEITDTTVIPSPRISRRVPFGTGRAVGEITDGKSFLTYPPEIFADLRIFLTAADDLYKEYVPDKYPPSVRNFLEAEDFSQKLREIRGNTASLSNFHKRFFQWFDAFRAMKFVHFARDNYYPTVTVATAVKGWLQAHRPSVHTENLSESDLLFYFREQDKNASGFV